MLALLVAGTLVGVPGRAQAAALPAGFTVRDLPSGQDGALTDFAFAPDGSWFTTGKDGRVAWVSAAGEARTLAQLPVVTVQDLGLTGLAVPADYATSRRIFTARTLSVDGRWTMRLSSWAVTGAPEPTGLADERVIWDLESWSDVHTMTALVPDPDGTLWVSIGDAADFRYVDERALGALDLDDGRGKVLHVLPDGRGVSSNPYYDPAAPSSWRSRVYASGFRSPFRMSLDPASGAPVLGDVGWNTWEEVNLIRPGASYGWPCWEGEFPTPGYADLVACQGVTQSSPLYTYAHGPAGTSVTGGIVYSGASYPEEYRGAYFFGDYSSQRVYTLRYDAQGRLVRAPEAEGFGVGNGLPVKFAAAVQRGRGVRRHRRQRAEAARLRAREPSPHGLRDAHHRPGHGDGDLRRHGLQRPGRRVADPRMGLRGRHPGHGAEGGPHLSAGRGQLHRPAHRHRRPRCHRDDHAAGRAVQRLPCPHAHQPPGGPALRRGGDRRRECDRHRPGGRRPARHLERAARALQRGVLPRPPR
ncbi:hypothetical protein GCM10023328_30280 [Modestobacter marinus]|uniref:Glucose/Sorbosone dehydrogenase domain-containing protein n=1 Tax=Modestobacter marinus TaxID=477641 RepID=A0ABQ2G065_9ACTN|nr:hypothetical protein GCM10011589_25940 [Modestobacter marinus]